MEWVPNAIDYLGAGYDSERTISENSLHLSQYADIDGRKMLDTYSGATRISDHDYGN